MNDYKSGTTAKAANELICNGPTATYRGGHLGMVAWKYYEAVERKAPVFRPGM